MTEHTVSISSNSASTWFITGASSGIGFALATAAAGRGDNVVALARDVTPLTALVEAHGQRVLALPVDVRRPAEIDSAVAQAVESFGRIDIVHNNAGFGVFGAVEETTDEQARGIFDTNVFGVLNVLRSTLPVLRAQRSGHILQGGSYYGHVAFPGIGLISATKFAVEGLSDALIPELAPLGIKVTIVEPGPTATPFGSKLDIAGTIDDYDQTVRGGAAADEVDSETLNTADRVAEAILEVVDAEQPPLRLVTGSVAVAAVRSTLQAKLDEIDAWESTSAAVDSVLVA